jgi:hypothetical protein
MRAKNNECYNLYHTRRNRPYGTIARHYERSSSVSVELVHPRINALDKSTNMAVLMKSPFGDTKKYHDAPVVT